MAVEDSQVYRDLMRLKPDDWTPNAWAVNAGVSRTVWADMKRHGNPSRRTLEKLLGVAGSSLAEFEALRVGESQSPPEQTKGRLGDVHARRWAASPLPSIPLLATSSGGEWMAQVELTELYPSRIVAQLSRPASLAGDHGTYAISIVGDSMWPRFRPGRRVAVSPRAPIAVGDDVVVRLKAGAGDLEEPWHLLINEMTRRTSRHVELRQFNPDASFRVPEEKIAAIHKIIGELI